MPPTFNPAADTHACEEAIKATKAAIAALNMAMEHAEVAARHSGDADVTYEEYRDQLVEIRDEFVRMHLGLVQELRDLSDAGSDNRPGSARLSYAGAA